jgi:hypothetical protein
MMYQRFLDCLFLSKTRGDIILKAWETNLAERKRLAREVNKSCEEALSSLDKGLLDVEGDSISEALGQIDIAKNQHNSKTSKEEAQTTIQQMKQIDLIQINKWIVDPSLQLQATSLGAKKIQDRLPHIEKKLYIFEANEATKPSGLVVQLVSRCIQCVEYGKAKHIWKQVRQHVHTTHTGHDQMPVVSKLKDRRRNVSASRRRDRGDVNGTFQFFIL